MELSDLAIRQSTKADAPSIRRLDALAFPPEAGFLKGPAEEEIDRGASEGRILLAEYQGDLVGFAHLDTSMPEMTMVQAIGVHPEMQGRGVAGVLLRALLEKAKNLHAHCFVACVTSPENLAMQRVLFRHGFRATRYLPDYYGAGKDRLWFVYEGGRPSDLLDPSPVRCPFESRLLVRSILEKGEEELRDLVDADEGWVYLVTDRQEEDVAALTSAESSGGVMFSTAVLAALTFLLTFAFGNSSYPDSVRYILVFGVIGTLLSLIFYANIQGEVSRLRTRQAEEFVRWGNATSEFFGVYPIIFVLPAVLAQVTPGRVGGLLVGLLLSGGFWVYEHHPVAIVSRYGSSLAFKVTAPLVAACPLLAAAAHTFHYGELLWAMYALTLMFIRMWMGYTMEEH